MNLLKRIKQVFGNEDQIPYLELKPVEETWAIPYLQPRSMYGTGSPGIIRSPFTSSVVESLVRFYDEALTLLTQPSSLIIFSFILAVMSTYFSFMQGTIISYGDAESHLNIAKRVVHSLTPGLSQLGGIWLPLPHLLMLPFVYSDFLWRSGLAGAIVSGTAFIISGLFLYKLVHLVTKNALAGLVAFLIFSLNPNILYLQATPMTELPLIMFFILSTFYFVKYLTYKPTILSLIAAAFFGFCASLSRYDGWLLVAFEAGILGALYLIKRYPLAKVVGLVTFFAMLAFFGIALWLVWGYSILGDPLYFTTSEFSAKSQQSAWLARGELPSYHNIVSSFQYYLYTAMENVGSLLFALSSAGLGYYLLKKPSVNKFFISLLLLCPLVFYVVTLYMGQSIIFIPQLTPHSFQWTLFNVRYGVMMIPICAFFIAYMVAKMTAGMKVNVILLLIVQTIFFATQTAPVISLADGTVGLSRYKHTDAQDFLTTNYDKGLVLTDDFARSISIIRSPIPMQNIIYIGNQPYWDESLTTPQRHAAWIIMQRGDTVWKHIYENPKKQAELYKYFNKVYTSPDILIFKKIQ